MKVKYIVLSILALAIGGMIVYRISKNNSENEKNNDKSGKKPPMTVSVMKVEPQDFSNSISLSGSIEELLKAFHLLKEVKLAKDKYC